MANSLDGSREGGKGATTERQVTHLFDDHLIAYYRATLLPLSPRPTDATDGLSTLLLALRLFSPFVCGLFEHTVSVWVIVMVEGGLIPEKGIK